MYAQTSEAQNRSSSTSSQEPNINSSNSQSANSPLLTNGSASNHPQLHLHMFCPCAHPYYRPPPVLSLPLHQLPRPYLQHYQYTQFNVNPYNYPLHAAAAAAAAAAAVSSATNGLATSAQLANSAVTLADFGPPPRDRRNMLDDTSTHMEVVTSARDDDILTEISHHLHQQQQEQVAAAAAAAVAGIVEAESFTKYLEEGLIQAEKIAIRNQHRPCFKNIQNLCNRTRGEILKTSSTYSNIHSQGIPWATKDFIYAFVRLINCWHMLKGYLDSKSGTLGNIDRELTAEFKATYAVWEKDTRDLAEHMVRVFTNLDNNVSSPNPNLIPFKKPAHPAPIVEAVAPAQQSASSTLVILQPAQQSESLLSKVASATRLMASAAIDQPVAEQALLSESTETSTPREEDSDNESRVYMKPGSYNIPKKNNSSDNSSRSYEFLETAQNVSGHFRKAANPQQQINIGRPVRNENDWRNAISASSNLINLNSLTSPSQVNSTTSIFGPDLFNSLLDSNVEQRGDPGIERWLEQSNFDKDAFVVDDSSFLSGDSSALKPITLLQRVQQNPVVAPNATKVPKDFLGTYLSTATVGHYDQHQQQMAAGASSSYVQGGGECASSSLYRSRRLGPLNDQMVGAPQHGGGNKMGSCRKALYEHEKGGLYSATVCTLERLIKILEQEDLAKRISDLEPAAIKSNDFIEQSLPQTLGNVWHKIQSRKYYYVNECVHDIKSIVVSAAIYYEDNIGVLNEIENFSGKLQECLELFFPGFDFSGIAGGLNEVVGPLVYKSDDKIAEQHKV